ncbi:MAG: Uma2 family endonuclease [Gemmatimonadetes bacterium]|nr:Uma2 family endonuclease [Gemmatimonadota bacterium]
MTTPALLTAEGLERISIPGKVTELIRGQLVVREPPGTWHGMISAKLAYRLSTFVEQHDLGAVFAQDTGFKIESDPDTVRGPDVAFVAKERLHLIKKKGYAALAPDLVVEVLSPDERPADVLAKVANFLSAGCRLAWVVDQRREEARVHRPDGSISIVPAEGNLDGEDVLPGFGCRLKEILG